MYIRQLYTGCLAEAAYYIESEGEAVIIDPLRDPEPYLALAAERGTTIKYIFETHFHADFVSGHVDLSNKTGAPIVYGPTARTGFDAIVAADGQEFPLGRVTITLLHTPGHTPESSVYLLKDENRRNHSIFTGDTLFIGDVGRPDLAVKSDLSMHDLAGMLYDSLHTKILPLEDRLIVYPGHGAGSACGKNISKETSDTLGNQKLTNYALRAQSKEQFIKEVTEGIPPAPAYFAKNAAMNQAGSEAMENVMAKAANPVSPEEFYLRGSRNNTLILDTRSPEEFSEGHVPGSINIGLDGTFAVWVGTVIKDITQPILTVAPPYREKETITRLARVGYDNTVGFLDGGFEAWKKAGLPIATIKNITPDAFTKKFSPQKTAVVDVRTPAEFEAGHLPGAINLPLNTVTDGYQLPKNEPVYVHCGGGYRSMVWLSIMKANGYNNAVNITDGMAGLHKTDVQIITAG